MPRYLSVYRSTTLSHGFITILLATLFACGGGSSNTPEMSDPDDDENPMEGDPDPVIIGDSTINTANARLEPDRLSILPDSASLPLRVTFPGDEESWPTDLTYRWLATGPLTIENIADSNFSSESAAVLRADSINAESPVTGSLEVAVYGADSAQIGYVNSEVIVEQQLTIKPAELELLRYDVPNISPPVSHACAVVAVSPEPEATSYRLRGVGGFDEAFYGAEVGQSPRSADSFCDLDENDYPSGFFLLSASSGPTTTIGERLQTLGNRFSDFIYTVDVRY